MKNRYVHTRYCLTPSGNYSITQSYLTLVGEQRRWGIAELVWSAVAQPKHRYIVCSAVQNRLLTKERMQRLNIPIDNIFCFLCNKQAQESASHLFWHCEWILKMKQGLEACTGVTLIAGEMTRVLMTIKRKRCNGFKQQILAAIWVAMYYNVWRARNWKQFMQPDEVVAQIKKDMGTRLEMFSELKRAQSCREFMHRLSC